MGLFNSIFGKTRKVEHDFFGQMTFTGGKTPTPSDYFECRRHFKPSNNFIEIGIDRGISGPTEKQIVFFKSVEVNYSNITKTIIPLIEDEFRNWKEGFKISDFNKEFEPVYIRIPRCESKPIIWEIAFESSQDKNHTFTLTMSDFEATQIIIDG
jgi:hypothetical protein